MSAPAVWSGDTSRLLVGTGLIRRDDWARLIQATDVLQIVEDLQATAESSRNQTLRDATEKGYREGLEQGRLAGLQELLVQSHTSEQFIASLTARIVEIAELAVTHFVSQSLSTDILKRQLQDMVEVARAHDKPRLLVAEIDFDAACKMISELFPGGHDWLDLQSDANLSAGDAVLECRELIVDGRVSVRIDRWRNTMRQSLEQKWQSVPKSDTDL